MEVSELCRRLKIHLIALYLNATRILQPADVAAFRPIKAAWKKELRDWYTKNNYQKSLTKETFAQLLKAVIDSCSKKETLINGFRVSGLWPFEPNNVDFSKCITRVNQPDDTSTPVANEHNMRVMTYSDFCDIVGETILEKCRTVSSI